MYAAWYWGSCSWVSPGSLVNIFIYLQRLFQRVLVFGNDGHFRLGYEKPCDSILDLFFVTRHPSRREFVRCPQVSPVDLDADVLYLSGSLLFEPFPPTAFARLPPIKAPPIPPRTPSAAARIASQRGSFIALADRPPRSWARQARPSGLNRPRCRHRSTAPLVGRARDAGCRPGCEVSGRPAGASKRKAPGCGNRRAGRPATSVPLSALLPFGRAGTSPKVSTLCKELSCLFHAFLTGYYVAKPAAEEVTSHGSDESRREPQRCGSRATSSAPYTASPKRRAVHWT